jgi:threonyl-tRNA synthetase
VRDAQLRNIPLILTYGEKEKASGNISLRTLDGKVRFGISYEAFLTQVLAHIKERKLDLQNFSDTS